MHYFLYLYLCAGLMSAALHNHIEIVYAHLNYSINSWNEKSSRPILGARHSTSLRLLQQQWNNSLPLGVPEDFFHNIFKTASPPDWLFPLQPILKFLEQRELFLIQLYSCLPHVNLKGAGKKGGEKTVWKKENICCSHKLEEFTAHWTWKRLIVFKIVR